MNKKGITLVEIIISIVLISIVLIFLFSLLVTVNDINDESEINSTYLINKSLILKNIESDLNKVDKVFLSECSIADFYSEYENYYSSLDIEKKAHECIKFNYEYSDGSTSEAYLGIYYYENKTSYVISYIHDNVRATRLLPDFELYNVDSSNGNLTNEWKYTIGELEAGNFHVINIPIIGSDGKDYSINISYYKSS